MKKLFTKLAVATLALSIVAPTVSFAETSSDDIIKKWDTERYGDRIDVDGHLDQLANDEEFQKDFAEKVKESAEGINLDAEVSPEEKDSDSNFTYDGGTKYFVDYEGYLKEFTLRSEGENVEIWVANDLSFPEGDPRPAHVVTQEQVDKLRDEFDSNIYPTITSFFGYPNELDGSNSILYDWGIFPEGYYSGDGDNIIILVDNVKDENYYNPSYPFFVAGFYWSVYETYIDRNIITIDTNSWETRLESTFFGTTIHELQHLVHDDNDSDETTWLNEGFSTFAEYIGGYGHDVSSINFLLDHPENSLTAWDEHVGASTGPETIADYGLVYLWTLYNYEKFGQDFILDVALSELNSIESYEQAYKDNGINETFQSVYEKFVTALLLDSDNVKGKKGIYSFDSIDLRALPVDSEGTPRGTTVNFESAKIYEKDGVPAWGADYKVLDFDSKIENITFDGVSFLPMPWETVEDPLNPGNQVLWGNAGDEADNNLIFKADLTNVENATLTFDHYYDIEEQWDFGMVQVSTDNGQTWTSLENDNTRSDVVEQGYPKIKENVPGFTGTSNGWVSESFDLSAYTGQEVYISFRYLTDWAAHNSGWYVDNVQVPEIGLSFDGSSTEGFMSKDELLQNYVNYSVTFVNVDKHEKAKVLHVDPFNVTEEDALQLRQLFKKGTNYMITWYAAPSDSVTPVPFEYSIELKDNNGKAKGKNNGKGKN